MPLPTYEEWIALLDTHPPDIRPRIAIGLANPHNASAEELRSASAHADIVIVGGVASEIPSKPSQEPERLMVEMLFDNEVQGIVKVDVDGIKLRDSYCQAFNLKSINRGSLISLAPKSVLQKEPEERVMMLYPISAEEGSTLDDRYYGLIEAINELQLFVTGPLHIGLLALARQGTAHNSSYQNEARDSYFQADILSERLNGLKDITARNYGIEVERAALECDIVSAFSGSYGNLLYRALNFFGNAKEIASPSFTSHPYIGGSRNVGNLDVRVRYAAARWARS